MSGWVVGWTREKVGGEGDVGERDERRRRSKGRRMIAGWMKGKRERREGRYLEPPQIPYVGDYALFG